jgi:hypothetical protein
MMGALALILMFGAVFSLLLRGRVHPWNSRLGNMRVRSLTGPNFATLLAILALAELLLRAVELPLLGRVPGLVPLLVAIVFLLIIGYVVVGSLAKVIAGAAGIALLIATEGIAGTLELVIVVGLLLWVLGAVRGWLG